MKSKTNKKILEENSELIGALKAFGRLEGTISLLEMQKFAIMEYAKTLGGSDEGFQKFFEEEAKKAIAAMQNKEGGASGIIDLTGQPMKTEEGK